MDVTSSPPEPLATLPGIEAALVSAGQPFEVTEEIVLGETMEVFRHRPPHLRAVLERSREFGDADYMVWADGRRYTYAQHLRAVANLTVRMSDEWGVERGDRIAILAANCPEWVLSMWAATSMGAVAAGLNAWWKGPEILAAVLNCAPRVLIVDAPRWARLSDEQREEIAVAGVRVVHIDDEFEQGLDAHPSELPDVAIDADDPAIILYTSGTTGQAKGAVHTHRNLTSLLMVSFFHGARLMGLRAALGLPNEGPNVVLVTSPLFHVSGLHCAAITALGGGAKTVWTQGRFDAAQVLRLIQDEGVTGWGYTATMLKRVVSHPDARDYDLSSMRMMGGGGSPIPPELMARARELVPSVHESMALGYGLTEACAFTTLNPGPELRQYPESAGRPAPTVQVEIRDAEGNAVADGIDGAIHVRGPLVMREYFRAPEATAAVLRDGRWLDTGDVGCLRGGRLYLASRKRDLIFRGGENVYPAPIEARLETHPAVAEAAIVGVADDDLGQRVVAFVHARTPDDPPSPEALKAHVAETMAHFNVPAEIRFVSGALPRNATGKVLKRVLLGERCAFADPTDH